MLIKYWDHRSSMGHMALFEIVSIAREKGLGCKIAVKSSVGGDADATLRACKGENNERFDTMKSRLSNEFLEIIPWSSDIKRFITDALYPLEEQDIKTIHLDEVNLVADVEVCDDSAYDKALGIDYLNTTLAMDLTEWQINIKRPGRAEAMSTIDEDLRKILVAHVPEIKNNELEIVTLARIEGIGSKVIVKWRNSYKKDNATSACARCINAIRHEVKNEWVWFYEWRKDQREQIINCIYPTYKMYDIISADLNDNVAIITVKSLKTDSLGRHSLNLSERVTGWKIQIRECPKEMEQK
jgi:transcription antitermination factor NusA-like protein